MNSFPALLPTLKLIKTGPLWESAPNRMRRIDPGSQIQAFVVLFSETLQLNLRLGKDGLRGSPPAALRSPSPPDTHTRPFDDL